MRSVLIRLVLGPLVASGVILLLHAGVAYAGTKCEHVNPATGVCVVYVQTPEQRGNSGTRGSDGPKDSGDGAACYWDPAKQGLRNPPAGPVPCSSPQYGSWSNTYNCYIQALKPQPPAGDPNWQGHQPGDGAVYGCYQPQTDMAVSIWAQNPPPGSGTGPTPQDVAQIAVKQMDLAAIEIGIAPRPGPDSVGLVGMPVWMWAKNPSNHTVGPITATASAGGITIAATAKLLHITWDMGDGSRIVCKAAGTPYKPEYGRKDSPDCGYTYKLSSAREPGQAYTVTATSSWVITWAGAGQTGTIRLDGLNRSAQIRIGEAQVLVD